MDLDGILASGAPPDQGGVRVTTERGEAVYDLAMLAQVLRQRCEP